MREHRILMQQGDIVQDQGTMSPLEHALGDDASGPLAMNLLPLVRGTQGAVIEGEPCLPVAPMEAAGGRLGLRPVDIHLLPVSAMGIPGKVLHTEISQTDTIAHVAVGAHTVRVRISGQQVLAGQACKLAWEPAAAHLLDAHGVRQETLRPFVLGTPSRCIPRPPRVGSFQH